MVHHMYERIPGYRRLIRYPEYAHLDEDQFAEAFRRESSARLLFVERYATVLSPTKKWRDGSMNYSQRWFWKSGALTNDREASRESMCLHFMRWRSTRYAPTPPAEGEGAWRQLSRTVNIEWQRAAVQGFA
jgi:hypothetical protein